MNFKGNAGNAGNALNNSINVQTATQPVLVVPLNIAQQAPPAELIRSGIPGAPPTFAVDTGVNAMNALGLSGQSVTNAPRRNASRSASPSAANSRVSVNKLGAPEATNSGSNVKVSVNKLG